MQHDDTLSRRRILAALGTAGTAFVAGCLGGNGTTNGDGNQQAQESGDWRSTELEDVRSGETFTVDSFEKPVVVQSFAVWCSNCQRQSEELTNLDDSVIRVGLNTDTNENTEKVHQHADDNGFDWRFAVASTDLVDSLREAFGNAVVNHPSTPVIVTCQDGRTEFFSGSVNPASELESAASDC
jgi:thiol-disulfide isomerase/thioredoxin